MTVDALTYWWRRAKQAESERDALRRRMAELLKDKS